MPFPSSFRPVIAITLPSLLYSIWISGLTLRVRIPVSFSAVPSCAGAPHPVRRTAAATAREETSGLRGPAKRRAEARHTDSCTTADAVDCARRALRDGGRFLLCQRPEQLAEVLSTLRAARLEPKRLAFVKNRPDAAPWLFLVEAQKGRKTGLRVEPDVLITSGAAMYGPRE